MIQIPTADIYLAIMALTRVMAMFLVLPVFSSEVIPAVAKVSLAGVIAIMLVPMLSVQAEIPTHLAGLVLALVGEIIVGFMLGYAGRLLFFAIEVATDLMARDTALMRARSFDPSTNLPSNVLMPLYFFLATMVFTVTGTHLEIIAALIRSYDLLPVGMGLFTLEGVEHIAREVNNIFSLGLRMAAPLMALAFIINVVIAILGKVAAKVNVLVLSFGVRILLGFLMLIFTVPLMLRYILNGFDRYGLDVLEFVVSH